MTCILFSSQSETKDGFVCVRETTSPEDRTWRQNTCNHGLNKNLLTYKIIYWRDLFVLFYGLILLDEALDYYKAHGTLMKMKLRNTVIGNTDPITFLPSSSHILQFVIPHVVQLNNVRTNMECSVGMGFQAEGHQFQRLP
jgi:hypothetical protein